MLNNLKWIQVMYWLGMMRTYLLRESKHYSGHVLKGYDQPKNLSSLT